MIVWLLKEALCAVHSRQIGEHNGRPGIRGEGLPLSALARPQNLAAYRPAARLGRTGHLVRIQDRARNHPFIDGNKRVALVAARTFLLINGANLGATQEEKYATFVCMAEGGLSGDRLAE